MRIAIAADHAGLDLKDHVGRIAAAAGHAVTDLGTHTSDPVDYPDYAAAVARAVVRGKVERGIVICGSGAGAAIAANKIRGARCAAVYDSYTAHQCVEHDDVNVLALGARVTGPERSGTSGASRRSSLSRRAPSSHQFGGFANQVADTIAVPSSPERL
jgi:RpiB/LacA/LacB family sugar-phosphate isomerase